MFVGLVIMVEQSINNDSYQADRGRIEIGVSLRWRYWISGSCRNKVTALVARGYCGGAGPMSCLLLSGQGTIILITIEN